MSTLPSKVVNWIKQQDWRKAWQTVKRVFWGTVLTGLFIVIVPGMRPDLQSDEYQTLGYARNYLFDFVQWEAESLFDKAANAAAAPQQYMSESDRVAYVRDYLALVAEIRQLENQIQEIYIDPAIDDPEAASADLRMERDTLRTEQESRQALAEGIIQAQVSEMLVEYGFGAGGQVFPPVTIRFTQLPTLLIISPRDHIERTGAYALQHGLTVDVQEEVEANVENALDNSALIVPIGGLAVWPSMLIETGNLSFVFEVAAHEWMHHYLTFFPLGFNYGVTPEIITINETVASIVGDEVGWAVLERYYPEYAPAPPDYTPIEEETTPETPAESTELPAFDFRAEMRETRIQVDEMLASGQIEEAERYMEERRIMFVEQGYRIRRLNQAYFAFYGSYADQPGATGSDPIGPAVREVRYYSGSLNEFARAMRGVTTLTEIQALLDEMRVVSADHE